MVVNEIADRKGCYSNNLFCKGLFVCVCVYRRCANWNILIKPTGILRNLNFYCCIMRFGWKVTLECNIHNPLCNYFPSLSTSSRFLFFRQIFQHVIKDIVPLFFSVIKKSLTFFRIFIQENNDSHQPRETLLKCTFFWMTIYIKKRQLLFIWESLKARFFFIHTHTLTTEAKKVWGKGTQ